MIIFVNISIMEVKNSKIPSHAIKVFSGIIFDVYQWQQEMFDGSFKTFEMVKRLDTVSGICVTRDKKIIMTKQEQPGSQPFYSVPSGRVEREELPLDAFLRELKEETGYESYNVVPYQMPFPTRLSKVEWNIYNYLAKNCNKISDQNLDNGERIEIMLLNWDDFVSFVCLPDFRHLDIQDYFKNSIKENTLNKVKELILN